MTPVSHALLPVFFGQRWIPKKENRPQVPAALLISLCGALPDILNPHLSLDARYTSFSHTVYALGIFTALMLAVSRIKAVGQRFSARVLFICVLAYAAHIFCDLITGGLVPFYPWDSTIYGKNYLPHWLWIVSDGTLLIYFYLIYRWLPLRRKMVAARIRVAIQHGSRPAK